MITAPAWVLELTFRGLNPRVMNSLASRTAVPDNFVGFLLDQPTFLRHVACPDAEQEAGGLLRKGLRFYVELPDHQAVPKKALTSKWHMTADGDHSSKAAPRRGKEQVSFCGMCG